MVDFRISEGPWYLLDISLKFSIPPDIGGEDPVESKIWQSMDDQRKVVLVIELLQEFSAGFPCRSRRE